MPLYSSEALVLRTYRLGEADRIVVFLTRDRGKKRGVAKGARRPRSRFTGALEPLTHVRSAYFEREQRELVRLNYAEALCSPLAASEPLALGYVGYFAELIDEWAPDAHPDERLYRLGTAVVGALVAGAPIERLARYFEYWLLRLQGVYPSLTRCPLCGEEFSQEGAVVAPRERVLVCRRCGPGGRARALSPEAVDFLRAAATIGPGRLDAVPLPGSAGRELEAVHDTLIAAHLEKELRSARVLREIK